MKTSRGFTLIEMVVVLAVVAILAAILTPTIAKNINDAKVSRADNEAQVIAAAIGSFFKDVGRWPTANDTTADAVELLHGNVGDAPTTAAGATTEVFWIGTGLTTVDTFENHLILNVTGGAFSYPTTANLELRWRGPYITEIKADPWGSYYTCNILYTYNTTVNRMVGVLSAGPNRIVNTLGTQPATTAVKGGDDILFRIQ